MTAITQKEEVIDNTVNYQAVQQVEQKVADLDLLDAEEPQPSQSGPINWESTTGIFSTNNSNNSNSTGSQSAQAIWQSQAGAFSTFNSTTSTSQNVPNSWMNNQAATSNSNKAANQGSQIDLL